MGLNDIRRLSALTIVKKMYDEGRNVYDIIAEMAKSVIIIRSMKSFSLDIICEAMNDEAGGLKMPSSVVKNAMKKLVPNIEYSKPKGTYFLSLPFDDNEVKNICDNYYEGQKDFDRIVSDLFTFVEKKTDQAISNGEKNKLRETFLLFLLDNGIEDSRLSAEVGAFVLSHEYETDFLEKLNAFRESLVIYQGLSYNADAKGTEPFERPVKIFLETEIMFHAAGFNGTLFQDLFLDFYTLVNEINQYSYKRRGSRLINLCYFPETKKSNLSR